MSEQAPEIKVLVRNRKARHMYHILETFEAGIELVGCEVKSLRAGEANLQDCYAAVKQGSLYLLNLHITPYAQGNRENPEPTRSRRLLMHKREIARLAGKVAQQGQTMVPLSLYIKQRRVKVEIALAKGKNTYDKRHTIKERDIKRETDRQMRGRG